MTTWCDRHRLHGTTGLVVVPNPLYSWPNRSGPVENLEMRCVKTHLAIPVDRTPASGVNRSSHSRIGRRMFMHLVVVAAVAVGLVYLLWQIRA